MSAEAAAIRGSALFRELKWFVQLRWIAGLGILIGSGIDMLWLDAYPSRWLAAVGAIILAYNS